MRASIERFHYSICIGYDAKCRITFDTQKLLWIGPIIIRIIMFFRSSAILRKNQFGHICMDACEMFRKCTMDTQKLNTMLNEAALKILGLFPIQLATSSCWIFVEWIRFGSECLEKFRWLSENIDTAFDGFLKSRICNLKFSLEWNMNGYYFIRFKFAWSLNLSIDVIARK